MAANVSSSVVWQAYYVQGKRGKHVSRYGSPSDMETEASPAPSGTGLPLHKGGAGRQAVFYSLSAEGEVGICVLLI